MLLLKDQHNTLFWLRTSRSRRHDAGTPGVLWDQSGRLIENMCVFRPMTRRVYCLTVICHTGWQLTASEVMSRVSLVAKLWWCSCSVCFFQSVYERLTELDLNNAHTPHPTTTTTPSQPILLKSSGPLNCTFIQLFWIPYPLKPFSISWLTTGIRTHGCPSIMPYPFKIRGYIMSGFSIHLYMQPESSILFRKTRFTLSRQWLCLGIRETIESQRILR